MSFQAFSKVVWRLPTKASRVKKIRSSAFFGHGLRQTGFSLKWKVAERSHCQVFEGGPPRCARILSNIPQRLTSNGIVSQRQIEEFLNEDSRSITRNTSFRLFTSARR